MGRPFWTPLLVWSDKKHQTWGATPSSSPHWPLLLGPAQAHSAFKESERTRNQSLPLWRRPKGPRREASLATNCPVPLGHDLTGLPKGQPSSVHLDRPSKHLILAKCWERMFFHPGSSLLETEDNVENSCPSALTPPPGFPLRNHRSRPLSSGPNGMRWLTHDTPATAQHSAKQLTLVSLSNLTATS